MVPLVVTEESGHVLVVLLVARAWSNMEPPGIISEKLKSKYSIVAWNRSNKDW